MFGLCDSTEIYAIILCSQYEQRFPHASFTADEARDSLIYNTNTNMRLQFMKINLVNARALAAGAIERDRDHRNLSHRHRLSPHILAELHSGHSIGIAAAAAAAKKIKMK